MSRHQYISRIIELRRMRRMITNSRNMIETNSDGKGTEVDLMNVIINTRIDDYRTLYKRHTFSKKYDLYINDELC